VRTTGTLLRGTIPAFQVQGPAEGPVAQIWGGIRNDGVWLFPAYYPFGPLLAKELQQIPGLDWDESAEALLRTAKFDQLAWKSAQLSWEEKTPFVIPIDEARMLGPDFFPEDFTPYRHQYLGIGRIVSWWRTWLLWDMGTGKTRTVIDALRVLRERGGCRRTLVIAPPVILETWEEETRRCSRGKWRAAFWDGTPKGEKAAREADIVLVSYDRVRVEKQKVEEARKQLAVNNETRRRYKLPELTDKKIAAYEWARRHPLLELDYDTIIADESHYLGNWRSARTQAAIELSAKATRRYCLTGTPGDDPRKHYGQLYFLSPTLVPKSYYEYENRHVVRSPINKHIVTGFRFLNEVNARVDAVALRMKKQDCLDLPPVTVQDFYYTLGKKQRARYNELIMDLRTSTAPQLTYANGEAPPPEAVIGSAMAANGGVRVTKLRQIISGFVTIGADYGICDACPHMESCVEKKIRPYTNRCLVVQEAPPSQVYRDIENPKLELYEQLVQEVLETDATNKVIVWGAFEEELNDLEASAQKAGVGYVRLDGNSVGKVRELKATFQQDPKCRVFIGQVSMGIGITLTAANYTIYYSLPWDPLQYRQSMDRNHRPGQDRPVTVYRLLSSNATYAIDRFIARMLAFKEKVSATMETAVACSRCERQLFCEENRILPFQEACIYAANLVRPVTKAQVVEGDAG
jgi:SNF2 family DNA or RNA helicase